MHALTTPAYASSPRVWLVTRPLGSTLSQPRTRARAVQRLLYPLALIMVLALGALALLAAILLTRGVQLFVIDGDGLQPSIPSGSLVVVEPLGERSLVVGQIITL